MSQVNLTEHYKAFKWAISRDWKDKNKRYYSIQSKMQTLVEEFNLREREILDDLFCDYWERGHYKRYNPLRPGKASLQNWVSKYVNCYLNNLIRKWAVRSRDKPNARTDPLDQQNWANIVWINKDNTRDDPDFQPEVLICTLDPERLLIAKETYEQLKGHFDKVEFDYVMQEVGLVEAAIESGCTPSAFQKRIERKRKEFIELYL